jgi:hypothetical protein
MTQLDSEESHEGCESSRKHSHGAKCGVSNKLKGLST